MSAQHTPGPTAAELLAALRQLDDERMHTSIRPAGGKPMSVVAIRREVFDAIVGPLLERAANATGSA